MLKPANAATHFADLDRHMEQNPPPGAVICGVDNACDFAPMNQIVAYFVYQLWKKRKEIIWFFLCSFDHDMSFLQPVEGGWCPCSKPFAGVVLNGKHEKYGAAPCKVPGLGKEELREAEAHVFDKAIDEAMCYLKQADTPQYHFHTTPIYSNTSVQWEEEYGPVRDFFSSTISKRKVNESDTLQRIRKEWMEALQHLDRRKNHLGVGPCKREDCTAGCAQRRQESKQRCPKFSAAMQKWHGHMSSPQWSHDHPKHFCSLLEQLDLLGDEIPSRDKNYALHPRLCCTHHRVCPNFFFHSKSEQATQEKIIHRM